MGILSFGKSKSKAAAATPYDWTTLEADPLVENPKVLSALAPWQTAIGGLTTGTATRLNAGTPEDDALYNKLRTDAGNELDLGGELSADEVRAADQGVLAGASARGMAGSPMTGFMAALRRASLSTQRKRERQGNAANILGLGMKRREADAGVLQSAGILGNQTNEFAEDIRRFGLNRYDTRQFNKNSILKDEATAGKNAAAAKSAGKSSLAGGIIGGVLKLL